MKKSYILVSISLILFSTNLVAQNIELPDVTTVIEGEGIKVEQDALPDFKDVLTIPTGSGEVIPVLPDINTNIEEDKSKKINLNNNKTVYSEISAGGGYPFLFFGNCEVQSTNKKSPFKLLFNYESANGYNGKALTDNYSDSNINLFFEKKYTQDALALNFEASYDLTNRGLQNKVEGMSEINKSLVYGNANVNYGFSNGINIGSDITLSLYDRFAKLTKDEVKVDDYKKQGDFITFTPSLYFKWSGYGFDIGLKGEYLLDANLSNAIKGDNTNRGLFNLGLNWHNEIVNAYGNVGIVFGNQLLNNSVLVPFNLGVDVVFPVYFSNRNIALSYEGGLDSVYKKVGDKEKAYSFAALSTVPNEEADWYGKLSIALPLKASFTGNFGAEYRKTAFDNGVIEADYSVGTKNLYGFTKRNQELLSTDLALTFNYGIFSIKGGWHANWFDRPSNEALQHISLDIAFQDKNSKWGASLFSSYEVKSDWEIPQLALEGFVQITPTVRLNLAFEDVINLFTGDERKGNGMYIDRGFSGSVFLKFVL